MDKMPDRITDGPQYDDDDIAIEVCYTHGDYDGVGSCPYCARIDTLKLTAISGLEIQLQRLTQRNAVDKEDLVTDIKRALNYLRIHA